MTRDMEDLLEGTDDDALPPRPRARGRTTAIVVIAAALVLATFVAGWLAASTFESPAQRAAAAKAPARSAVTAPITRGDLSQLVSANGTIGRAQSETVTLTGDAAVVTGSPVTTGDAVSAGTVVAEVNGRPRIAMPGAFRFYRDLTVGDTGPDVRQLQSALNASGFNITADGSFGSSTADALRLLYAEDGYSLPTITSTTSPESTATSSNDDSSAQSSTSTDGEKVAGDAAAAEPSTTSGDTTEARTPKTVTTPTAPADEFIVFRSLPATITSVPSVGAALDDKTAVTVEEGAMVVKASVASDVAASISKGMTGTATGPDGKAQSVTVEQVGQPQQDGDSATVLLQGDNDLPSSWLHKSAVVQITVTEAASDSLLAPTNAVISGSNGHAHVLKRSGSDTFVEVPVTESASLAGKSAITPDKSGLLSEGDEVKVG